MSWSLLEENAVETPSRGGSMIHVEGVCSECGGLIYTF